MIFVWKYMFYMIKRDGFYDICTEKNMCYMIKRDGFYDICMELYVLYAKTGWFL